MVMRDKGRSMKNVVPLLIRDQGSGTRSPDEFEDVPNERENPKDEEEERCAVVNKRPRKRHKGRKMNSRNVCKIRWKLLCNRVPTVRKRMAVHWRRDNRWNLILLLCKRDNVWMSLSCC